MAKIVIDVPDGEYCKGCKRQQYESFGYSFCYAFNSRLGFDKEGAKKLPECLAAEVKNNETLDLGIERLWEISQHEYHPTELEKNEFINAVKDLIATAVKETVFSCTECDGRFSCDNVACPVCGALMVKED